ncbi:MAG: penicillin-binding protein 1C [Ancalomicrobiaceae bacterium]|nr:penicillin-binding protein 1C [Ancalomicrobiaceae bacterium]
MKDLKPVDVSPADVRSVTVVDRNGRLLRPFTTSDGRWRLPVKVDEVDPAYVRMLLAYEDNRFRDHHGVDIFASARAAWQLIREHRIVSGGSTITMQVARLLEPRDERSFAAKARQAIRALQLEQRFSKDEILSLYLSLAPFGGNVEGLRAASLAYFGKEPRRLSPAESALLVALPQSPETRRPDRQNQAALVSRNRVLERAAERHILSRAEWAHAIAEPMPSGRLSFPNLAPHLSEELVAERPDLKIQRTTLDYRLQATIEAMVRDRISQLGSKLSAAVLIIDNFTGEVRAHVGGADYFSVERSGGVDLTRAFRSPGSALKPFIYALAFENGQAHPETSLEDRPARFGAWAPENFDQSFHGTVTARYALQQSLNVPAVEMLNAVGPARLVARLKGAGAELQIPKDAAPGLAIGLGGLGIRLTDLARLYTGLARGGQTIALKWRLDPPATGKEEAAVELRLTDPVSAWYVADILRGAPPPLNALPDRLAYKTGTSYGYRDAWAVGFDRHWTVAVWVGRPDGQPMPGLVGRLVAAPILFDAYQRIGTPPDIIPQPPNALIATTATLPPPLRMLARQTSIPRVTLAATTQAPLQISYPPDGARIDLGLTAKNVLNDSGPLALKALGGVPPLTWMVDGVPVTRADLRRTASWQPDGAGFARVSVVDARGAVASVRIRLE